MPSLQSILFKSVNTDLAVVFVVEDDEDDDFIVLMHASTAQRSQPAL